MCRGVGVKISEGVVKKRESTDFRSPEVGISDYVEVPVGTPL